MKTNKQIASVALLLLLNTSVNSAETTLKISGDSSYWDIPNNQMKYIGNAVYSDPNLTIKGDEIVAQKSANKTDESIEVKGSPAQFNELQSTSKQRTQLSAKNIQYLVQQQIITAQSNVKLTQVATNNDAIDITGHKMQINQADNYHLAVSGSPLTVRITQQGQAPINAEASSLSYDRSSEQFELTGQVMLNQQSKTMRAEKVLYNMKTGILQVPKSPNKQVEIIQSKNTTNE